MGVWQWLFGDTDDSNWALSRRFKNLQMAVIDLEGEIAALKSSHMRIVGTYGASVKKNPDKQLKDMVNSLLQEKVRAAGYRGKYEAVAVLEPTEEPPKDDEDGNLQSDRPSNGKGDHNK